VPLGAIISASLGFRTLSMPVRFLLTARRLSGATQPASAVEIHWKYGVAHG
jgi:hypothetical protein